MSKGIITVRLIRSFEHRNIKHIIIHDVDFSQKVKLFKDYINNDLATKPGIPPPFKKYSYDTLKISHKAHGAKSNDPVIDIENDHLILEDDATLTESGIGQSLLHDLLQNFNQSSTSELNDICKQYLMSHAINRDMIYCLLTNKDYTNDETEISFFRMEDYRKYQANPHLAW